VDADLGPLATALYVTTDDLLDRVPLRPRIGIAPQISDAELLTLAVMQALLSYTSEARWLRYARAHLVGMFPHLPPWGDAGATPATVPPWLRGRRVDACGTVCMRIGDVSVPGLDIRCLMRQTLDIRRHICKGQEGRNGLTRRSRGPTAR
jgi:hypothetical protein